jgi:hypothetical protein
MLRRPKKLFAGTMSIVAVLLVASAQQAREARHAERERFIGTWELVSTEEQLTDGSKRPYPAVGKDGKGFLMYGADGHMCAELMNPDRPKWKDEQKPTDQEKALAMGGFIAYCGRYELDEAHRVMFHHPEVAWMPNYVGTRQERPYKLEGDILTFSNKASGEPGIAGWTITWRKLR